MRLKMQSITLTTLSIDICIVSLIWNVTWIGSQCIHAVYHTTYTYDGRWSIDKICINVVFGRFSSFFFFFVLKNLKRKNLYFNFRSIARSKLRDHIMFHFPVSWKWNHKMINWHTFECSVMKQMNDNVLINAPLFSSFLVSINAPYTPL